jgi:hypothetical protein
MWPIAWQAMDWIAAPTLMGRIGRATHHLVQATLDDRQAPGDPQRVIDPPGRRRVSVVSFISVRRIMPMSLDSRAIRVVSNAFIVPPRVRPA